MARRVELTDDEVVVTFTGLTAVAALRRRLRIPRGAIVAVSAGAPERDGWRVAGTALPFSGYRQGVFRREGRWEFLSFEDRARAVTLELRPPARWRRVVVGVDDPEAVVRRLGAPGYARGE